MIQSVGAALAKVALCSLVLLSCTSAPAASPFSVGLLPDNTPNPVRQPAVGQVSTLFTQVDARIAFVRDRDVYILDATTGIETRLTEGGANSAPRWTTDGTALFFTRNVPGETGRQPSEQTWRWREGTGLEQVQTGVWAPDGSAVAYAQPVSIHDSCISSTWPAQSVWLEARGERVRLTPEEPDVHWKPLAWSPDGQRLALARINPCATTRMEKDRRVNEAEARLLVIEGDLFSGRLRELMMPLYLRGNAGVPDLAFWSPDGRFLTVGAGPDTQCNSCRVDGLVFHAVPADGSSPIELDFALTRINAVPWALDDSFVLLSAPGGRETYVRKQLVRFEVPSGVRTDLSGDLTWADIEPAVSPDGGWIAFARSRGLGPRGETHPDLPPDMPPTMAAISARRLWLMRPDGSDSRQITDERGWTDGSPVWTLDGKWLIFVRWRAGVRYRQEDERWLREESQEPGTAELWAIRPDGSDAHRLIEGLGNESGLEFGFYGAFSWHRLFAVAPR